MVTAVDILHVEALFCSDLQPSQEPSGAEVRAAVAATTRRYGSAYCADLLAGEAGDHPEAAAERMHWAIGAVRAAYEPAHT